MVVEKCCLCLKLLESATERKTRKCLYGTSCVPERDILGRVIKRNNSQLNLASYEQLHDTNALLCAVCSRLVLRIQRLENDLAISIAVVQGHLALLQRNFYTGNMAPRKRLLSNQGSELSRDTEEEILSTDEEEAVGVSRTENAGNPGDVQACSNQCVTTNSSPNVIVKIKYRSGTKNLKIVTPARKKAVSAYARKSYKSVVSGVTKVAEKYVVAEVSRKIRSEMAEICSVKYNSLLRKKNEQLKHFSWDELWIELTTKIPSLVKFLQAILPGADKFFIAFVVCMLIKKRCKHMSLMQRIMSVLLYGHAAKKQIYRYLQPFMICMSPPHTLKIIDELTDDYDVTVLQWSNRLKDIFEGSENVNVELDGGLEDLIAMTELCDTDNEDVDSVVAPSDISWFTDGDDDHDDDVTTDDVTTAVASDEHELTVRSGQAHSNDMPSMSTHEMPETDMSPTEPLSTHSEDNTPLLQSNDMQAPVDSISSSAYTPQLNLERNTQLYVQAVEPCGLVIVGDNIDKNFRPSYQRQDRQTKSLHYFHAYAVKNRVDVSSLSDARPAAVITPENFLPTQSDLNKLLKDFETLISRKLVQHMPGYKNQVDLVDWHIPSQHCSEMATQSNVIPLGVILKNEANLGDMCHIVGDLSKYVPSVSDSEEEPSAATTSVVQLLFFGDQLTVERARGAMILRSFHEEAVDRLEGFVPAVADWHARMTFVKVIWDRLYSTKSSGDKGTLYQLKNLVHRSSVGADPSKNMKAFEDFLLVVLSAHIIVAAELVSSDASLDTCTEIAKKIISKFVKISIPTLESSDGPQTTEVPQTNTVPPNTSTANLYATDLVTLGLLWHGFHDAIREGDGDRILLYWKFLLPVFKEENHHNYAKESFNLLLQSMILSPRKLCELKWSRTVNTHGKAGHNVPCDLHMEHLNRRLKNCIRSAGSNVYPMAIQRIAKSLGPVSHVCSQFEKELSFSENKDYHTFPSFKKDLNSIIQVLRAEEVLSDTNNRCHSSYNRTPLLHGINWNKITEWLKEKLCNTNMYQ